MKEYRRIFKILFIITALWFLDPALNLLGKLSGIEHLAVNIILPPGLIILWGMYFRYRFAGSGRMKFCIQASLVLLLCWILFRQIRFDCFWISVRCSYFMWYLYYAAALLIPMFCFLTALYINRAESWKLPIWAKILTVITLILCVLIVTNNLHRLAFRFEGDFSELQPKYTHGIVYYIMTIWQYLMYILSMGVMIVKCRLSHERHLAWIPLLPFAVCGLHLIRIAAFGEFRIHGFVVMGYPETCCLMIALFLESCLQIGLLPSNESFGSLMRFSSFPGWIADRDGQVIYSVADAGELSREQLTTPGDSYPDPDSILHCSEIPGGFGTWRQDISQENAIHAELQEVLHQLEEEEVLIRLENKLKEDQEKLTARKGVYDAIARKAAGQFTKISALAEEAEQNPSLYVKNSAAICVLSAYVKRCANLMLLLEDAKDGRLSTAEFGYAIQESLHYLQKAGVKTIPLNCKDVAFSGQVMLDMYSVFEKIVEEILMQVNGIAVFCSFSTLTESEITLRLVVEGAEAWLMREIISLPCFSEDESHKVLKNMSSCGDYQDKLTISNFIETEDDIIYITITGKAGDIS